MKKRATVICIAVFIFFGLSMAFNAHGRAPGGGHQGGGHSGGTYHGGGHHGSYYGGRYYYGGRHYYHPRAYFYGFPYYAYPYYYPDYYYPYGAPGVYIEQPYWYYCAALQAYYPDVTGCPGGWTTIVPRP